MKQLVTMSQLTPHRYHWEASSQAWWPSELPSWCSLLALWTVLLNDAGGASPGPGVATVSTCLTLSMFQAVQW